MTDEQTNEKEDLADIADELAGFCSKIGRAALKLHQLSATLRDQVHEEDSQKHPENVPTEKEADA